MTCDRNHNRWPLQARWLLIPTLLLAITGGCGSGIDLAPVEGSVEFDGAPLTTFDNAAVVFTPKQGRLATGIIQKNGDFQLSTYGNGDGVMVGIAKLSVSATTKTSSTRDATIEDRYSESQTRDLIPSKFRNPDTSGLTCEVRPGETNAFRILLKSDGTAAIERK